MKSETRKELQLFPIWEQATHSFHSVAGLDKLALTQSHVTVADGKAAQMALVPKEVAEKS